jgi:hypothetical protein
MGVIQEGALIPLEFGPIERTEQVPGVADDEDALPRG